MWRALFYIYEKNYMLIKIKAVIIIIATIQNIIFGFTTPTVQIYFMSLVNASTLSIANLLDAGLAGTINSFLSKNSFRKLFKKYAPIIGLLDAIIYAVIVLFSIDDPTIRFIGIAISNGTLAAIWGVMLLDSINNTIHGDELTSFNSLNKSCCLFGSLIGGAIGVAIGNHLDINIAIILQAIMVAINSVSELYAFYKLDNI